MDRPTQVIINQQALAHNLRVVKKQAPKQKIIAMVKANAYGCGIESVIPLLEGKVDAFGVASMEEAIAIRKLGGHTDCVLFQGVRSPDSLKIAADNRFQCVINNSHQLHTLLNTPLEKALTIWIKVNTGMNRLGFCPKTIPDIIASLNHCQWITKPIGLMTHFACADDPSNAFNQQQLHAFSSIPLKHHEIKCTLANSAAILALPTSHADVVRPGIMLYGVSPFANKTGRELGLLPVMHFVSRITVIHAIPAGACVGYNGTWCAKKPSRIAVIPVGYGDGYPRHIQPNTPVWISGKHAPIVGNVSMDMLTIDITAHPDIQINDCVELWGAHLPIEQIALSAGTIAYELLSQISPRARANMDNINP